jgi:hypothetical protein
MGTFRHLVLGGLGLAAGFGMTSASAAPVAFNFGSLGANGGPVCSANCIIPNQAENTFTTGGVTVGAIGYGSGGAVEFVTQKPGAIDGPGETGLGESSTGTNPSDSDYEITDSTYLLIDDAAARAAGYSITSFEMQSIQSGEGGKIYGYTGPLSSINTADLTLLDTLTNPPGAVTQRSALRDPNSTITTCSKQTPRSAAAQAPTSRSHRKCWRARFLNHRPGRCCYSGSPGSPLLGSAAARLVSQSCKFSKSTAKRPPWAAFSLARLNASRQRA